MDFDSFYMWLVTSKKLNKRSAKDVISRLRRTLLILNTEIINEKSLSMLNSSKEFEKCSMYIKSQLRRAITLYNEFKNVE